MEIPFSSVTGRQFEVEDELLDADQMIYNTSQYAAYPISVDVPEAYNGRIVRICTDDIHIGYVRLIREKDNSELLKSDLCTLDGDESMHGPAVLKNIHRILTQNKYSLSNNVADGIACERIKISFVDKVYAVHSPYWPVEAIEWVTRKRSNGFPSKSVIKQVIRHGCDFVQVSHNRLSDDNDWRFSFSKAELLIAQSWTMSQRIVYSTLWVLNKRIAVGVKQGNVKQENVKQENVKQENDKQKNDKQDNVKQENDKPESKLCSYYFKTLMFWACEEKPTEFWQDDLLVDSVSELLIEMIKLVESRFCQNYFIPGNNMMDHLIDEDLFLEVDFLWITSQSGQLISEIINKFWLYEQVSVNRTYHMESPAWIKRTYVIHQRIYNVQDNYIDLFDCDLTTDLQNALCTELPDIYRGLHFQQKSVSCGNERDQRVFFLKSESHLLLAVNLCESHERSVMDMSSCEFDNSICSYFMRCDTYVSSGASNDSVELNTELRSTIDKKDSLNAGDEQKCLLHSRSVEKLENQIAQNNCDERTEEGRSVNITVYHVTNINTQTKTHFEFYKDWPGQSPTVNISWFIAKAYLANLYYTTQHDVNLTIQTCDDVIDVYR